MRKEFFTIFLIAFINICFARQVDCSVYFNISSENKHNFVCFYNAEIRAAGAFHKEFKRLVKIKNDNGYTIMCSLSESRQPCDTEYECLSVDENGIEDIECRTSRNIQDMYDLLSGRG